MGARVTTKTDLLKVLLKFESEAPPFENTRDGFKTQTTFEHCVECGRSIA